MRANDAPAFPILPPLDANGCVPAGYPYPADGMTLRDYFAAKAPIDFDVVCRAWGSDDPNLLEDKTRAAFFAVWALLRYEWADAMLAERAEP